MSESSPSHAPSSAAAILRAGFADGQAAIFPTLMGIAAYGMATGVAMAKSSLALGESLAMTLLVYAGSAQLAALPLIAADVPLWTVVLTATIVNLRFLIFSAALQPHFRHLPLWRRLILSYCNVDQNFVLFATRFAGTARRAGDAAEADALRHREGYFYGMSIWNWSTWQVSSIAGIVLARQIPDSWGLTLVGTLALVALMLPLMASRPGLAAVLSAGLVAVALHALPYKLNLVIAAVTGIVVGVWCEERAAAREHAEHVATGTAGRAPPERTHE